MQGSLNRPHGIVGHSHHHRESLGNVRLIFRAVPVVLREEFCIGTLGVEEEDIRTGSKPVALVNCATHSETTLPCDLVSEARRSEYRIHENL